MHDNLSLRKLKIRLINRAVLIHGCGGKLSTILVDGGTALNKAIGDENEQNKLLTEYSIQKRRCFAHIIRMVSFPALIRYLLQPVLIIDVPSMFCSHFHVEADIEVVEGHCRRHCLIIMCHVKPWVKLLE